MNGTVPGKLVNEIISSSGMKRMTDNELKNLSESIRVFLGSQDGGIFKTGDIGNVSTRLLQILNASDARSITRRELEHLRKEILDILSSHDMKIIQYRGITRSFRTDRSLLSHCGLTVIKDNDASKLGTGEKE